MPPIDDHPLRFSLANELHARPFPPVEAPCHALFFAIKPTRDAVKRDRGRDRAHLTALLDRFGATHPSPESTHHFGEIGRATMKWESHTEFVTYTAFSPGLGQRPFDPALFEVFPVDWLDEAPGVRVTSVILRVDFIPDDPADIARSLSDWFVPESLACSRVQDGSAIIASDFRIDSAGHLRMAVFVPPGTGSRRIGRIVQRLCEIETYKSMSMLGLARARQLSARMGELDGQLSEMVGSMTINASRPEETLSALLAISAELENLLVQSSFRFGATGAYEAIVNQRIEVLREERLDGRQTFGEFMMRRYDPAMRTVKASEARLHSLAERAMRAGTLLGTRVDVDRSAQNQRLLESMDQRADMQLRLQRTVEGLSVVAISYYAVGLVANMVVPVGEAVEISKGLVTALMTPPVVLAVWFLVRRVREKIT